MREFTASVTERGQVTIPAEVRRLLGLKKRDKLSFVVEDGIVTVRKPRFTLETGMPPRDGVLALFSGRATLSEERHDDLLVWVAGGGTLVTEVRIPEVEDPDEEDPDGEDLDGEDPEPVDPLIDFFELEFDFSGVGLSTEMDMGAGGKIVLSLFSKFRFQALQDQASAVYGDDYGGIILVLPYGDGRVVLINDAFLFTNAHLGENQNAALLYKLMLLGDDEPSIIWIVFRETYPTISELLGLHAWMALVSLALMIILGIWTFAPRLGPIRPDPPPIRRRLMEHIEASGQFIWRHRGAPNLVNAAREAMTNSIRRRHPEWLRLSEQEQRDHLREISGLSADEVRLALETGDVADEAQFTAIVGKLETIRRAL